MLNRVYETHTTSCVSAYMLQRKQFSVVTVVVVVKNLNLVMAIQIMVNVTCLGMGAPVKKQQSHNLCLLTLN